MGVLEGRGSFVPDGTQMECKKWKRADRFERGCPLGTVKRANGMGRYMGRRSGLVAKGGGGGGGTPAVGI